MSALLQKVGFVLRFRCIDRIYSFVRKMWFSLFGMNVGKGTFLPKIFVTWPHQVSLGKFCLIEHHVFFKFDGIRLPGPLIKIGNHVFIGSNCEFNIRKGINIGNDSLIGSGCRFIDHDHGTEHIKLMRLQEGIEKPIVIEENVWIGCNVVVLKGVTIGSGAIVAAGAVVTKSIGKNEIWGGTPAKFLKNR